MIKTIEKIDAIQTNRVAIVGGPSSGKTELIKNLKSHGYDTRPEAARTIIEERKETILAEFKRLNIDIKITDKEARGPEGAFQESVVDKKISIDENADPNKTIYFDRAMVEPLVYEVLFSNRMEEVLDLQEKGLFDVLALKDIVPPSAYRVIEESQKRLYKTIFFLEPVEFIEDGLREDKEFADNINKLYKPVYEALGYELITVPKFLQDKEKSIKRRREFVLEKTGA